MHATRLNGPTGLLLRCFTFWASDSQMPFPHLLNASLRRVTPFLSTHTSASIFSEPLCWRNYEVQFLSIANAHSFVERFRYSSKWSCRALSIVFSLLQRSIGLAVLICPIRSTTIFGTRTMNCAIRNLCVQSCTDLFVNSYAVLDGKSSSTIVVQNSRRKPKPASKAKGQQRQSSTREAKSKRTRACVTLRIGRY